VSLRPAIAGDDRFERPPVVATGWRRTVVVDWPLKLLSYQRRSGEPRRWLYDLGSDPAEATDLGAARPDDLRRLDRFCAGAAE
jgi:hypothetical protein